MQAVYYRAEGGEQTDILFFGEIFSINRGIPKPTLPCQVGNAHP